MLLNEHEEMKRRSKELLEFYHQKARGWEPDEVADLTEAAALDWLFSLTETLDIWREKVDGVMTDGEVILGYANLGILLEGWLTLYLTVYLEDFRLCLHELNGIMALSQRRGCHHGEITASA